MAENNDVLATVKLRLGITDQDELIKSYIDEIGERIKHYCNIKEISEALKSTWAAMTIDAMRIEQPNLEGIEATSGVADAVQLGDTSVRPAEIQGLTNTSKEVIDQVVLNYRVDLNRYRRLRW